MVLRTRHQAFHLLFTGATIMSLLGALLLQYVAPARADALADCNEAIDAAARIAGCDVIIAADPPPDVLAVALMNRGIGHAQTGDLEKALEDLNAALAAAPGMLAALYNRGNVQLDLGRTEAAIADFSAVIEGEPGFALAWLNRGLARERAGAVSAASADFKKALALDPKLDAARRALARHKRSR
jgi:tetratricopeptide (TPR) repeat protein